MANMLWGSLFGILQRKMLGIESGPWPLTEVV